MAILLAVATAVGWGASDYFGGDASRRETPVFVIVAIAELLGIVLIAPILIARGNPAPDGPRTVLAVLAGVAVTVELGLIYRAIGQGYAFITAPTAALGSAAAVTIGLVDGDPLDLTVGIGLVCALLGGSIAAWTSETTHPARRPRWQIGAISLGAAAAVGTALVTLHGAGRLDPYWATTIEHASTALSAAPLALIAARRSLRDALPRQSQMPRLAVIAAVGAAGDLAYTAASHHGGALSVVSAISSLYPLTTIALGRVLQRQHASSTQLAGIALALLGALLLGTAAR
jgi:drug/metabolite transporter (DMT)-like permease